MLVSPYKDVTQYTKIQIKPHMMNSDIQNIMKLVLRKKVEKRCNKYGLLVIAAGCNVVRLVPPLIIKNEHVDEAMSILETVASEISGES